MNFLWQQVSVRHISDVRSVGYKTSLGISKVNSCFTVGRTGKRGKIGSDHGMLLLGRKGLEQHGNPLSRRESEGREVGGEKEKS